MFSITFTSLKIQTIKLIMSKFPLGASIKSKINPNFIFSCSGFQSLEK